MKTKYVRIPFEVELAKKITNDEIVGKIVTQNGESVRIVCFNRKDKFRPIIALVNSGDIEVHYAFSLNGKFVNDDVLDTHDLMLEIPEYMTFKDGDVIAFGNFDKALNIAIFEKQRAENNHKGYVSLGYYSGTLTYDYDVFTLNNARFATEEEKQKLINALKSSKEPKAKEYLKRFFGIEVKQEYEFKPFDKVLARFSLDSEWCAVVFSHKNEYGQYICCGSAYNQCIPYNEKTAHLLGTTENYE